MVSWTLLCYNYFVQLLPWRQFIVFTLELGDLVLPLAPVLSRGLNSSVVHSPL